jgi:glycosyltransferase involved in cell wall biosynthesis
VTRHKDSDSIIVSVLCPTYNHERYLAKALDGFLLQKTDFPIEVIVHDDASTDQTALIVQDYQSRYPGFFSFIKQTENQYSKRESSIVHEIMFPRSRGKYIAICEGDDYWIDPTKLQKQVAFLEGRPDFSMVFHAVRFEYPGEPDRTLVHRYRRRYSFTSAEIILGGGGFYPTGSALFRRDVFWNYPSFFLAAPVCDAMWSLNAITKGTVGYIDEVMGVYHCGAPGSWTDLRGKRDLSETLVMLRNIEIAQDAFDAYTKFKYHSLIRARNSRNYLGGIALAAKRQSALEAVEECWAKLTFKHKAQVPFILAFVWFERLCANYPFFKPLKRPLMFFRRLGRIIASFG